MQALCLRLDYDWGKLLAFIGLVFALVLVGASGARGAEDPLRSTCTEVGFGPYLNPHEAYSLYGEQHYIYVQLLDCEEATGLVGMEDGLRLARTYVVGGFTDGDPGNDAVYSYKNAEPLGDGLYRFRVAPTRRTWFQVRFDGDQTYAASDSLILSVNPYAKLTAPYGPLSMSAGESRPHLAVGRHTIYGNLWSYHAAGRVGDVYLSLQKWVDGRWKPMKHVAATNYGHMKSAGYTRYAASIRFFPSDRGLWRMSAQFVGSSQNRPQFSGYRQFYVR